MATFTGKVSRVIFTKDTFVILEVQADKPGVPDLPSTFKLSGNGPKLSEGDCIECKGAVVTDPKYGKQFKAKEIALVMPRTTDAVRTYLASGIIKGLGRMSAARIMDAYKDAGDDILGAIMRDPSRLEAIVGSATSSSVVNSLTSKWGPHETILFLRTVGLKGRDLDNIYVLLKDEAKAKLTANPYQVAGLIGFEKCDAMGAVLKVNTCASERLAAGVEWIAEAECQKHGHTMLSYDTLCYLGTEVLDVSYSHVEATIMRLYAAGTLVKADILGHHYTYLRKYWMAEHQVADSLAKMMIMPPSHMIDEADFDVHLTTPSEDQVNAYKSIVQSKVSILTGSPGTGKTTVIKGIVAAAEDARMNVALCAPTGMAARRMRDVCKHPASTIHRLLGKKESDDGIRAMDMVIVDEMSMVGIELFRSLINEIKADARLVLVGDPDQLPSISPGNVLNDLIDSGMIPVNRLTTIHRQGDGSLICANAARVNDGQMPVVEAGRDEFHMQFMSRVEDIVAATVMWTKTLMAEIKDDTLFGVQVLVPTNNGEVGSDGLNRALRSVLNPGASANEKYATGDKIIQCANDYDKGVVNGEIGRVVIRDTHMLRAEYADHTVTYANDELLSIKHAYSITIHKSQGSEFPYVIIIICDAHGMLLMRRLVYTAMTRGKKKVIIIGHESALRTAVENNRADVRHTGLAYWLSTSVGQPPVVITI
jgi:exodeoxyribonuclease V alpha subunit